MGKQKKRTKQVEGNSTSKSRRKSPKKVEGYFIQLGLRKNGRIVKNQQHPLDDMALALERGLRVSAIEVYEKEWNEKPKIYKLFVSRKKYVVGKFRTVEDVAIPVIQAIFDKFKQMIEEDD